MCNVQNQDIIENRSNREIATVTGKHESSKSNDDVKAVWIANSKLYYFPKGLEIFENLEGIVIDKSGLREIRKDDLKPFINLRHLSLNGNNLQVIESNLFENNQNLELIILSDNLISHIDPNVFDIFQNKLSSLFLAGNNCSLNNAYRNSRETDEIISEIQTGSCSEISKFNEFRLNYFEDQLESANAVSNELRRENNELREDLRATNERLKNLLESMENNSVKIGDNAELKRIEYIDKRLEFIENTMGIDPKFHHQNISKAA